MAKNYLELLWEKTFNESTLTDVLDKELEFEYIDLKIDPPPELRRTFRTFNWAANYLKQPRKDRVVWPSKIYNFEKKFVNKTLFEQAEQLTDLAAEEFADWINTLGSDEKNKLTKDLIKDLFAIGIEGDASKALCVEPKRKRVVPHEVAESLNMPHLSIEFNVKRVIESDMKEAAKKRRKNYAFGSSLPLQLKQSPLGPTLIQPDKVRFPMDLRSCQVMFQGIDHLTSIKTLIEHLLENPDLPRPQFLKDRGMFQPQPEVKASKHIPLYTHFLEK